MEIKKTICTIFIAPTLKIKKDILLQHNYVNSYYKDENHDFHEDSIYMLFKPPNLTTFNDFLQKEYENKSNLIEDYSPHTNYVVLIYKLNPKLKKDYDLIKSGQYSKTSKEFQQLFPEKTKITIDGVTKEEVSIQYRIFNKTQDLKMFWEKKINITFKDDMEIWSIWDDEAEKLTLDKILKYEKETI